MQAEHATRIKEGARMDKARGLRGKLFKVFERKSLRRTFPTAWTCIKVGRLTEAYVVLVRHWLYS